MLVLFQSHITFVTDMQSAHTKGQIARHFFQQIDFRSAEGIDFLGIHRERTEYLAIAFNQRQRNTRRKTIFQG